LKTQLEEAKRVEGVVIRQLKENEENYKKLEVEIVFSRKELEKTINELNISLKFGNIIEALDSFLSFQMPPFIKMGLGYNENKRLLKEMQALRSQGYQKRKMKKSLKGISMF
jgi:hypothetical protein